VQFLLEVFSNLAGHAPPFIDGMLGGGFMYLLIHVIGRRWRLVRREPDQPAIS
jgi:hypothetical protein